MGKHVVAGGEREFPTGGYDDAKLINVGTTRWSFKADLGYIQPIRRTWQLELDLGAWFFTDNDEFLGRTRQQNPILAGEVHLVKLFRRGIWGSFDRNYYAGGRTTIGGVLKATTRQREVLQLIAEGATLKGIAAALGISPKTAEKHRYAIMEELDLHTTAELTRYAIQQGIVSLD